MLQHLRPALPYEPRHRAERTTRPVARRLAAGTLAGVALGGTLVTLTPAAPALAAQNDSARDAGQDSGRQDGRDSGRESGRDAGRDHRSSRAHETTFGWRNPDVAPVVPRGSRVVDIAASKAGTPYAYGASGPAAFDCSGFTSWVYARVGRSLPRTSSAQAGATRRISAGEARPGDLVFFTGGGGVYHVGIYAGGGSVWHSPRPGQRVQRSKIWTSSVFYGRVR